MDFKREYIDTVAKKFNEVNKQITNTITELVDTWDVQELYSSMVRLKSCYDELFEHLKFLFVEIRHNLLLLEKLKEREQYKKYCQISL